MMIEKLPSQGGSLRRSDENEKLNLVQDVGRGSMLALAALFSLQTYHWNLELKILAAFCRQT
jgi:hypothetical protein